MEGTRHENAPVTEPVFTDPVWKLVVEYDGTDFSGWQWQPGYRTVQAELERGLSIYLRRPVRIAGAGRTDTGVHATGQVASFRKKEGDLDLATADLYALNSILPFDLAVRRVELLPPGFHARFSAIRRHYAYRLRRSKSPVDRRNSLRLRFPCDVGLFRAGASRLVGRHDFASFGAPTDPGEPTVCTLERVELVDAGDLLILEVSGNRFLRKMVRTLVGVLLEVARGRKPPEWVDELLAAKDRRVGGAPVAAQGLTLVAVDYPAHFTESKE